jgi:hypothetical protein
MSTITPKYSMLGLACSTFQNHCTAPYCTVANWTDQLPWSCWASSQQPGKTTTPHPPQAVFGSPLILPGQYLDSPEPPSEEFINQFSRTLSAA